MSDNQGRWGFLSLTIVTTVGMVFGASLFGLYRFVSADAPKKSDETANWSTPGMARSGPTVSVEKSSDFQAPAIPAPTIPAPAIPAPAPVIPAVELPPVRQPDVIPVTDNRPAPMIPTLPAAPVEVKPPVPAELPAVKPTPLSVPKVTTGEAPKGPQTPTVPSVSGPTELGPFKLNSPEAAPAPRTKAASLPKSAATVPSIPKGTDLPFGPSAPLPNRPAPKPNSPAAAPALPAPTVPTFEPASPAVPEKTLQIPAPSNTFKFDNSGSNPGEVSAPKPAPFLVEPMPVPTTPAVSYPAPMLPAPGVEPMPLPSRQLFLSTTLGVAMALTPATTPIMAQQPMPQPVAEKEPAKTEPKKEAKPALDEWTKTLLEDLKKDLVEIKKKQKDHEDLILGKPGALSLIDQGILKRISDMESRINRVEETLKKLEESLKNASKSTSAYPGTAKPTEPAANPAPVPAASSTKAFIRVVNDFPAEMSILINGTKSYRVASGSAQMVEVPPGSYSYELLHTGAQPKTGTIKEGETITLRIN
jgi:hypothetical protein